jgi:uncharacterized protein
MLCPICRKTVQIDDPYMPFCSDRCRVIDLGNWASEKYVIPAPLEPEELERILARQVEPEHKKQGPDKPDDGE